MTRLLCIIILLITALPSFADSDSTAQHTSYIIFNGKGNGAAIEKDTSAVASPAEAVPIINEIPPPAPPVEVIPAEENVISAPAANDHKKEIKEDPPKKKRGKPRTFLNVLKGILLFIVYLVMGIGIITGLVGMGLLFTSLALHLSGTPDEEMQTTGIAALLAGAVSAGGMFLLSEMEFFDDVRDDVLDIMDTLGRIFSFPFFY